MGTLFTYSMIYDSIGFYSVRCMLALSTLRCWTQLLSSSLGHHSNPLRSTPVIHVLPHIPVSTEWADVQWFTGTSMRMYG